VTSDSWSAALDRIDADLTATERALDHGGREARSSIPALSPELIPSGAMPPELGPRAEELLRRTRHLEGRAAQGIEGIREALQAVAGHRRLPARRITGRIVDVGA
jgi:hypothetical protein